MCFAPSLVNFSSEGAKHTHKINVVPGYLVSYDSGSRGTGPECTSCILIYVIHLPGYIHAYAYGKLMVLEEYF